EAVFDHVRRSPFARDLDVIAEVPGEVVGKLLRPALHFPAAEDVEAVMIEQEHPARRFALGRSEGARVDALRSAVQSVGPRIAAAHEYLLRFDHLDDTGRLPVGLGIENM